MKFLKRWKDSEQADQISAYIVNEDEGSLAKVVIINRSKFPISKAILSIVNTQVAATSGINTPIIYRTFLNVVPPGEYYARINTHRGMNFLAGVEIAFKDKDGKNWVRNGDGILKSINQPLYEYYSLSLPLSWEHPKEKGN